MHRTAVTSVLLIIALTGCRSAGGALISPAAVDPGDDCPNGGTAINTGVDDDGDGVLSVEEIEDTVIICNGASGEDGDEGATGSTGNTGDAGEDAVPVLFRSSSISAGDADCPGGGTRVEYGLDNGDGGETAGDGVLGDGEVDSSETICNGTPADIVDSIDEPGGFAGPSTILSNGGSGTSGDGGDGGSIEIDTAYANTGNISVFTTGQPDASFTMPTATPDLEDAHIVDADVTAVVFSGLDTPSGLTDGELFVWGDEFWEFDSGGFHTFVEALLVENGATLTIGETTTVFDATLVAPSIEIDRLQIEGKITTGINGTRHTDLSFEGDFIYVDNSGVIDLSGDGEGSGDIDIEFELVIIEGVLDSSANSDAYDAGNIYVTADVGLYSTGEFLAYGSPGGSEGGGDGGDVDLYLNEDGPIYSSTFIDTHGGTGLSGGSGGEVDISCDDRCIIRNYADIDASGGDGSGEGGGDGGDIDMYSWGAPLVTHGTLDTSGGDDTDGSSGGDGGEVSLYSSGDSGDAGRLDIGGMIDASGGDGDSGGDGGEIDFDHGNQVYGHAPITLFGYAGIEARGGASTDGQGGQGGDIEIYHDSGADDYEAGSVVNYAPLDVSGGDGIEDGAGDGGYIELYCGEANAGDPCFVHSRGDLYANAGNGGGESNAGEIQLTGADWIDHQADIYIHGGDENDLTGNRGGELGIETFNDLVFEGNVEMGGSDTTGDDREAGNGGEIYAYARNIDWTGDIDTTGGDASGTNTYGGSGGTIWLQSFTGSTQLTTTSTSTVPGTGTFDGESGSITIDGIYIGESTP